MRSGVENNNDNRMIRFSKAIIFKAIDTKFKIQSFDTHKRQ